MLLPSFLTRLTRIVVDRRQKRFEDLPATAQAYVLRCEQLIGVPIKWIGVGAAREDLIERDV